jgi:DNA-directed RNA polymerase subunit A"
MSALQSTKIKITGPNNFIYSGEIGKFIDNLIEQNKAQVIDIGNDSVVLDLQDKYNIIGVSNQEKTSWKRISQVSRHPANGGLVKVSTKSGKTTTATLSHSFLKRTPTGIAEIRGSDLRVGQRIPVAKSIPEVENALTSYKIGKLGDVQLDRDFGWLCGVYIADGYVNCNIVSISKVIPEYYENIDRIVHQKFNTNITQYSRKCANFKKQGYDKEYASMLNKIHNESLAQFLGTNFGKGSENKCIPAWAFGANKEFIAGLVQGYFDGDGNVNGDAGKCMIRAGSISEDLINDMIILLAYFGIFASKCLEVSKTGAVKKAFHTIQISRKYGQMFKDSIGFVVKEKDANLDRLIDYMSIPKKQNQEYIDKVPCVTSIISRLAELLPIPNKSKYTAWESDATIGRTTLIKYVNEFRAVHAKAQNKEAAEYIALLEQAAFSDVVWDEIVKLEYLDDPKEYVYDFTVPGNDSFMVDTCVLVHNTLNTSNGGVEKRTRYDKIKIIISQNRKWSC